MRLIILEICGGLGALVFLTTLTATVLRRAQRRPEDPFQCTALTEYLWSLVPWIMMSVCALPAVRLVVARH